MTSLCWTMDNFCGSVLWNENITWYTQTPDFTPCFQKTVFIWVPCSMLWLFTPLESYLICSKQKAIIPWTSTIILKVMIAAILAVLSLLEMAMSTSVNFNNIAYPVDHYTPLLKFISFILSLVLIIIGRKCGVQSSPVLFIFWFLLTISYIVIYRSALLRTFNEELFFDGTEFSFTLTVIYLPLIAGEFFLSCFSDIRPDYIAKNRHKNTCPENYASFLSRVTFTWFNSLAYLGYKKPLQLDDMWALGPENCTSNVSNRFDVHWLRENKKAYLTETKLFDSKKNMNYTRKKINIIYPILKTFGVDFFTTAVLKFFDCILAFANPLILDLLIDYVSGNEPYWRGFLYASLMFFSSMLGSFFNNQHEFRIYCIAMRIRSCIISSIYRKSLVISSIAKQRFTVGEIVNLMAVDTQRVMDFVHLMNLVWVIPLQICIAVYLLWQKLGISTLGGLSVMILLIPFNGIVAAKLKVFESHLMKEKDKRISLMSEILNGIKVLKLYAWEESFLGRVMEIRNRELSLLKTVIYLQSFLMFVVTSGPFLISIASFTMFVFVSTDNILDANTAFVSLSLFNMLRIPLGFFPKIVTFTSMFIVSFCRINKFLQCDELDFDAVSHEENDDPIVMEDASFSWGDTNPVLKDISVRIRTGTLVAVVGQVGTGKSSFLSALLGEMSKHRGYVNVKGTVAYVPQQAWIQNATLRKNVLFTKPYKKEKFKRVVEACALNPDLEILPAGDQTEIGEKGINLSGGQKQRVSLARAVYNEAEIYLFDDPLSAVDAHVSKHIFEEVIGPNGMLKRKTRILATHSISVLPKVDVIMVMKDGYLSEYGTYTELLKKDGAFARFVLHFLSESVEEVDLLPAKDLQLIEQIATRVGAPPQIQRHISRLSSTKSDAAEQDDLQKLSKQLTHAELRRQLSRTFTGENDEHRNSTDNGKCSKLTDAETVEVGSVKWNVYYEYLKAVGKIGWLSTIFGYTFSLAFNISTNVWLSLWSNDAEDLSRANSETLRNFRLGIYGALGGGETIFNLVAALVMNLACLHASKILHNEMVIQILHSPMSFFDITPMGRVLNRFSKDIDAVDITIRFNARALLIQAFRAMAAFIIICMETVLFLVALVPFSIAYYLLQKFYVPTSRQVKRLESVTRSPIYAHFSETVTGATSIRAYGAIQKFTDESNQRVDTNHCCYFPSLVAGRWLAVRLEFLGYTIVLFAALFAVLSKDTLSPGIVGLSISYALNVTSTLNALVRASTDIETNIVAIERCLEYIKAETEAPWHSENTKPSKSWPEEGNVQFENYSTHYRESLDLVLNNVTCNFTSGEKIGIVGRTGAGKSSLTLSLFRIIEAVYGKIMIDNIDISTIGLHDLRSKLTVIPQDPILFTGTLRRNLDPFDKYSDEDIWIALEHSYLKSFVKSLEKGLYHPIAEGGENLSMGQRQLICLARALLRKSKILILDEATASVDIETDALIQTTIRKEFAESTVITIAHRLNTVMDYDKIMVLSKGKILEWNSPTALLKDENSEFYSMAKDAGLI